LYYTFKKDSITYKGYIHLNKVNPIVKMQLITRFIDSHDISVDMEQDERIKVLKNCKLTLKLKGGKKSKRVYEYSEPVDNAKDGILVSTELEGVYGKKKIFIETSKKRRGDVRFKTYTYDGVPIFKGYAVFYYAQKSYKKADLDIIVKIK